MFVCLLSSLFYLADRIQITSNEHHLHLAAADGAPGFDSLVQEIVQEFGVSEQLAVPIVMDDYNSDWDPLYPFSAVGSTPAGINSLLTVS